MMQKRFGSLCEKNTGLLYLSVVLSAWLAEIYEQEQQATLIFVYSATKHIGISAFDDVNDR